MSLLLSNVDNHIGTMSIRIAPMYAGKTTWLNNTLTDFADKGFSVLKISHSIDVRKDVSASDNSGSTHNSSYTKLTDKIDKIKCNDLSTVNVDNYHVIGIDEAQFFDITMVEIVNDWVDNLGKHVYVAGLDADSRKREFGHILKLISNADEVVKMSGTCHICLQELKNSNFKGNILAIRGSFTKKIIDDDKQVDVGGSDKYIPVCRYHHNK